MNSDEQSTGSHVSEPVHTPKNPLEYEWLTVDEAVVFCAERGLSRTPKTLRKWAERSFNKEDADIIVRREDTMWSYRWKIEKASLARKIDQELSLSGANASKPVRTSSPGNSDPEAHTSANFSEPVRTVAKASEVEIQRVASMHSDAIGANASEPVRNGSLDIRPAVNSPDILEEVRQRLKDKDAEIAFLREQLGIAQTEVERRATSTDEALKTIDRVVRSFEMQAEANKVLALRGALDQPPAEPKTVHVTREEESEPAAQDAPSYQQPEPEWRGL